MVSDYYVVCRLCLSRHIMGEGIVYEGVEFLLVVVEPDFTVGKQLLNIGIGIADLVGT